MKIIFKNKKENKKKIDWGAVEKVIAVYNQYFSALRSRILLHIIFWLVYFILQMLIVKADYSISLLSASIFGLRNTVIGICAFYLLIYLFIPRLFLKKRFLAFAASFLILFWMSSIINYVSAYLIDHYGNLESNSLKLYTKNILFGSKYMFSIKNIVEMVVGTFSLSSIPILLKITLDFITHFNKKAQLEKQNLVLELNFLKSQLNPHFLFNALNNIYSLSYQKDDKAADLILQLSDLMRYTLYEANTEFVYLEKEIAFLKNYIELEKVRHNRQTNIEFTAGYNEDEIKNIKIAPLIFFNFVENAFKHGISSSIHNAWVKIMVEFKNKILSLKIENGYNCIKGIEPVKKGMGGIGIENTKKRLLLLYPDKHILDIKKTNYTYQISLSINLA